MEKNTCLITTNRPVVLIFIDMLPAFVNGHEIKSEQFTTFNDNKQTTPFRFDTLDFVQHK